MTLGIFSKHSHGTPKLALFLVCFLVLVIPKTGWASTALKIGDNGDRVKSLQQQLGELGYAVPITGYFGEITHNALKDFQRNSGLTADGILGPQSAARLERRNAAQKALRDGVYIVRPSDNFRVIGDLLGIDADSLAQANCMTTSHPLYIGQALTVPNKASAARADELVARMSMAHAATPPEIPASAARISLTLDGHPEYSCFEKVLCVLDEHPGTKVTFFIPLEAIDECSALITRAAHAGHAIENHGSALDAGCDASTMLSHIGECQARLRLLCGQSTSFYRPLGYTRNCDIVGLAALSGHTVTMWTNLGFPPPQRVLEATKDAITDGAVIRLSLSEAETPTTLAALIEHIDQNRYLTVLLKDCQ